MILFWRKCEEGASLAGVHGTSTVISLPDTVEGVPIVGLEPYCFSERTGKMQNQIEKSVLQDETEGTLLPIEGNRIERLILPGKLRTICNGAFYNCRNLQEIVIGNEISDIGSDVFVNCRKLKRITIQGDVREDCGAQKLLQRISSEIELVFLSDEGTQAALLYPEYYEVLDEIAPAHIFGRNIVGEGFRARQYFKDGVIQLQEYDSIFEKAKNEENVSTLQKMALNRLRYPIHLTKEYKEQYETFLKKESKKIVINLVEKQRLEELVFLLKKDTIEQSVLDLCIQQAAEQEWSEGAATLLNWKKKSLKKKKSKRYEF